MSARSGAAHRIFLELQDRITGAISGVDGASFRSDEWTRPEGGGGRSCVLTGGAVIEKGGVAVSHVHGEASPELKKQLPGATGPTFSATGISVILHPRNPHAPTVHMNFRTLETGEGAWFGGGADLTPWILYAEDAEHFHRVFRDVCARHAGIDHGVLKKWCDEYFYLPHRHETRGIGGIFFDYLGSDLKEGRHPRVSLEAAERFALDAASSFLDAYLPLLVRRKDTRASDEERHWQLVRRGRYVEFNLMYDRGTIFGLKTGGRVESILMSLPSPVEWVYMHEPQPGYQSELVEVLNAPRDWVR
jgi:coproporphyrinogen III oxidase